MSSTHQLIDQRSIELHRAVAEKIRANPALLEIARLNARRSVTVADRGSSPACADWQDILDSLSKTSSRSSFALRRRRRACDNQPPSREFFPTMNDGPSCALFPPMNRRQLEHVIRAAVAVIDRRAIYVFGSQAVLGQFPDAPPVLLVSDEADIVPVGAPTLLM